MIPPRRVIVGHDGVMTEPPEPNDPHTRWRMLPARIRPEEWVDEHDESPVPGSVLSAPDVTEEQTRQWGAPA